MTLRSRAESAKKTDAAPLAPEQQAVVQAIYDYFREHAAWPTFITIDRPLRRDLGIDTAAVVQSLPESMIVPPNQGLRPLPGSKLRLRLLGVAQCKGGARDTRVFVETLRWLAEKEAAYEPPPGSETDMPRVTSAEVAEYLVGVTDSDPLALKRLHEMLSVDNWGIGGFGSNEDGWYVTLTPDIWRFHDVETVEDCIKVRENWRAEAPSTGWTNVDATLMPGGQIALAASPYVNEQVTDAIRAKQGQSTFDVTKLLGLIDELNDNYARRNSYASHMLLRGILDHIPPIFGCTKFAEVVNNCSWGRTDERYIKRLAGFRDQADDALHRQISAKHDVLDFDDVPSSVGVDRLLQECAEKLLCRQLAIQV